MKSWTQSKKMERRALEQQILSCLVMKRKATLKMIKLLKIRAYKLIRVQKGIVYDGEPLQVIQITVLFFVLE